MCNLHHNYSHAGRPAFITTRTHGRRSSNNGLNTLGQKIVDQSWKRQVQGGNEHNLRTMGNGVISANKNKQVMTKEATSFSRVDLDRSKLLPRLYE